MTTSPILALAGGGTGGHLYPALAVAEALGKLVPGLRLILFGTHKDLDGRAIGAYGGRLVRQSVRPLPRWPWQVPGFLLTWRASTKRCREVLRRDRPLAVLGTGGYASGPAICEAARAQIPTALLNPDAVPGRANHYLGRRVDAVFAQWQGTVAHFNGHARVCVTGCPVRPEFKTADRTQGIRHFGLDPDRKLLLVTGASQGARSVNLAMLAAMPELARWGVWERWQLLHLTGTNDEAAMTAEYRRWNLPVRVVGFTKHMAIALAAADLVLSRAGASTLAEITALARPSVLMPYPHHRDQHQAANARELAKLGAARIVPDRIDPRQNGPVVAQVLHRLMTDGAELEQLSAAARRVGTTDAAATVARRLLELARPNGDQQVCECV